MSSDIVIAAAIGLTNGMLIGTMVTWVVFNKSFERNPDSWVEIIRGIRERKHN